MYIDYFVLNILYKYGKKKRTHVCVCVCVLRLCVFICLIGKGRLLWVEKCE